MSLKKSFGCVMLLFMVLFSYTPIKAELVDIVNNATLTTPAHEMFNNVFGYVWVMFAIIFAYLAIYFGTRG